MVIAFVMRSPDSEYVPVATWIVADVSPPTIAASAAAIAVPIVANGAADVPGLESLPPFDGVAT